MRNTRRVLDEAARRAQQTYDAAADHYDLEPLGFWNLVGARTVERLGLTGGEHVLDVPCGSGASALAAARAVGPSGQVVAFDLAERLLERARAKAATAGLDNTDFRFGDMRSLEDHFRGESFDAIVCVFGIFFVPDMADQVRRFWGLLRPGGVLAITTWGQDLLEPGDSAFWAAVADIRPDLVRAFNPWELLVTPDALLRLFEDAGIGNGTAEAEELGQPIRVPDDLWTIVMGTGYRGTVEALDAADRERVREQNLAALAAVSSIRVPVIYGLARKA